MTKSSTTERDVAGKPVEITWKMDGHEHHSCADGSVHARSIDSRSTGAVMTSRLSGKLKGDTLFLKAGESLVENLTATHSIEYKGLYTLYPCIAIIDDNNMVYSPRDLTACRQPDCVLLAEVGIAPVSAYGNPHAQDETYSNRHHNAFVLDHKMTDLRLPPLRSQLQEYSTREGFVMRNALPFTLANTVETL